MASQADANAAALKGALFAAAMLISTGGVAQEAPDSSKKVVQSHTDDDAPKSQEPRTGPKSVGVSEKRENHRNKYNDSAPDLNDMQYIAGEGDDIESNSGIANMIFSLKNIIIIFTFSLIAIIILFIALRMRPRRKLVVSHKNQESGMANNNRSTTSPRAPALDDPRDVVIAKLQRKIEFIERRLQALEQGMTSAAVGSAMPEPQPQSGSSYLFDKEDSYYDRKRERHGLFEEKPTSAQPIQEQGYSTEIPRTPQSSAVSLQQFEAELVELFNRANKPDFDALASLYGAETYTNDRRGDLARLIKDDLDRFWVVPVPGRSDMALMIPGFTVKKSWAKLRQPETDHPLAYHFDLRRGDRLQVIKPAILHLNANNFWELHQKGEVVGLS